MKTYIKTGLSKLSYQDLYYDGFLGYGESFDEDTSEIIPIQDYWTLVYNSVQQQRESYNYTHTNK
ncbi:hypothetical protein D3P07_00590 [Paenibacillus sp. 1011MAR3C5]|uniref:hypothetical protein n=1 Tax=Paenibacillus sp. 1011MAR3C5 TaxID=1675787 RepID=UPI000E6B821E|nr:hypothetical protein [Paenibacillus sp. 1011MAR3C5]RJE90641.1 hypothetical protein D3P07_00590 [Paenibacillus sp. 1011MAR3C5]